MKRQSENRERKGGREEGKESHYSELKRSRRGDGSRIVSRTHYLAWPGLARWVTKGRIKRDRKSEATHAASPSVRHGSHGDPRASDTDLEFGVFLENSA